MTSYVSTGEPRANAPRWGRRSAGASGAATTAPDRYSLLRAAQAPNVRSRRVFSVQSAESVSSDSVFKFTKLPGPD